MIGLFGKKLTGLVGIDISSSSIKLLELSRAGSRLRVDSFNVLILESDIVEEKTIKNKEALAEAINRLVGGARTSTKAVAVALPDSSVISKVIQVESGLSEYEIENQISFEADKYIPYPLEEINLDFCYLGEHPANPEQDDVLIVACRSETINALTDTLREGHLVPKIVDVESYAMERACQLMSAQIPALEDSEDKIITIFDLGSSMTNLTVISNGEAIYSREELFGGEQLIAEIMSKYELSRDDAYKKLCDSTLPGDFTETILEPFKEAIVLHVRRALQFFFSASSFNEIHHILLAGGNANIPGIVEVINEQLGVPTTIANPFKDMRISARVNKEELKRFAPAMMLCCGLAMRVFDY